MISPKAGEAFPLANRSPFLNRSKMPTNLTDAMRGLASTTSDEQCFITWIMPSRKCAKVAPEAYLCTLTRHDKELGMIVFALCRARHEHESLP
jgi:hypothetical protein